jgi:UDP-N-acetylmuramoylalanine--D-glutamate ligase
MAEAWVVGLGKSGFAAAQLLKRKGWQVWVSDRRSSNGADELSDRRQQLINQEVVVDLGLDLLELGFEINRQIPQLVVVSPGIAWTDPGLTQARQLGIRVIGEVELAWQYLHHVPWLSITGTNGKTTTTAMIAKIFAVAGFSAPACGNIGLPISEIALWEKSPDWIIAELSSYQIESAPNVRSQIGVWTTFTPDHLSRHGTLEYYSQIKASLLINSEQRVLNGNDSYLAEQGQALLGNNLTWTNVDRALQHGADIQAGWVRFNSEPILELSSFRLTGEHNRQNLLIAVAAAKLAGIESKAIATAIAEFNGVPHRLEYVSSWRKFIFINDSKATNYEAAWVGLKAVADNVILIAGGEDKQGDPAQWLELIKAKVNTVLLIGAAAERFAQMLQQIDFHNYLIVETLENAIAWLANLPSDQAETTVLFSPACASFDQYNNFEQRGDRFRQLCLELSQSCA